MMEVSGNNPLARIVSTITGILVVIFIFIGFPATSNEVTNITQEADYLRMYSDGLDGYSVAFDFRAIQSAKKVVLGKEVYENGRLIKNEEVLSSDLDKTRKGMFAFFLKGFMVSTFCL